MTLARPHKFLDAAALDEWLHENYIDLYHEWTYGDAIEWLDLWDWLVYEHDEVLSEFEQAWREDNANTETVETQKSTI